MGDSEQAGIVDQLQEVIDAVLVCRGFATGQAGATEGRREIVWCAAADDFAARFPELPASQEPADGWGTMCTDVVVDLTSVGGQWRLSEVSVEGEPLDRLLAGLDLSASAGRAAALIGATAEDSLALVPPLLIELLDDAGPRR
ncbi:hypothetical protein [Kineococcus sp. SYSU DK001]|uniref:hypothetical protein n=1 Tax=Kineococcus sp. SYSU DK001 TaxID=3383122 RepID=UPI003D7E13B2